MSIEVNMCALIAIELNWWPVLGQCIDLCNNITTNIDTHIHISIRFLVNLCIEIASQVEINIGQWHDEKNTILMSIDILSKCAPSLVGVRTNTNTNSHKCNGKWKPKMVARSFFITVYDTYKYGVPMILFSFPAIYDAAAIFVTGQYTDILYAHIRAFSHI